MLKAHAFDGSLQSFDVLAAAAAAAASPLNQSPSSPPKWRKLSPSSPFSSSSSHQHYTTCCFFYFSRRSTLYPSLKTCVCVRAGAVARVCRLKKCLFVSEHGYANTHTEKQQATAAAAGSSSPLRPHTKILPTWANQKDRSKAPKTGGAGGAAPLCVCVPTNLTALCLSLCCVCAWAMGQSTLAWAFGGGGAHTARAHKPPSHRRSARQRGSFFKKTEREVRACVRCRRARAYMRRPVC